MSTFTVSCRKQDNSETTEVKIEADEMTVNENSFLLQFRTDKKVVAAIHPHVWMKALEASVTDSGDAS